MTAPEPGQVQVLNPIILEFDMFAEDGMLDFSVQYIQPEEVVPIIPVVGDLPKVESVTVDALTPPGITATTLDSVSTETQPPISQPSEAPATVDSIVSPESITTDEFLIS